MESFLCDIDSSVTVVSVLHFSHIPVCQYIGFGQMENTATPKIIVPSTLALFCVTNLYIYYIKTHLYCITVNIAVMLNTTSTKWLEMMRKCSFN